MLCLINSATIVHKRIMSIKVAIIVFLLLTDRRVNTNMLYKSYPIQSPIVAEKTMDIIQSCYSNNSRNLIMNDDLGEFFHRSLLYSNLASIVIIDKNFESHLNNPHHHHIAIFVLSINSTISLKTTLKTLKSSSWWNIEAMFFILEISKKSCNEASTLLNITWEMNLLSSLFICEQVDGDVMMFTYNPYINYAPAPWKQTENSTIINGRWTLYEMSLSQAQVNCASLHFDKTKFLNGYEIKVVGNPKTGETWNPYQTYDKRSFSRKLASSQSLFFENLFFALNATAVVYYDNSAFMINGQATGYLMKLMNGVCDMGLNERTIYSEYNLSKTYPLSTSKFVIITKHRNFLEPYDKIVKFYSINVIILVGIVFFLSFIIMLIYINFEIALAALEILRLILNTSIRKPLTRISIRIYFFSVFVLIIVITTTFTGHLSAFLTKLERYNANTIEDLQNLNYNIYLRNSSKTMINWMSIKQEYFHVISGDNCYKHVINDCTAACIGPLPRLLLPSILHDLHISRQIIWEPYVHYWVRQDFPLLKKINIIRFRLNDFGLLNYWYNINEMRLWEKLIAKEAEATHAKYRPIRMHDLMFAVKFLLSGLACSTIVFIIELLSSTKKIIQFTNRYIMRIQKIY